MTNRISALLLAGANWPERLIACVGAVLGIGLTMVVCAGVPMAAADLPIIVAPLGASAVLLGRPQLHALAVAGMAGVAHALHLLRTETEAVMAQLGCRDLAALDPGRLFRLG